MWASDRNDAEAAACFKKMDGTLGKSPNTCVSHAGADAHNKH